MKVFEIKAAVRERDGYKCRQCGCSQEKHMQRYGRILEVHRLAPGAPYSVDGCVTLCKPCHGPKRRSPRYSTGAIRLQLDKELLKKLHIIAVLEWTTPAAIITELISSYVSEKYPEIAARG